MPKVDASFALSTASALLRSAYTHGRFQLILDGHPSSAFVKSAEGGLVKANLIEESTGPNNLKIKHLSTAEIEPISLDVGIAATMDVIAWFRDSWKKKASRRNGAIVYADFDGHSQFEQEFYRALVTEVTFPTLDASSKDGMFIKVKIAPEEVALRQVAALPVFGIVDPLQKMFSSCAFQLEIDGIECSKVSKIEGISFKQGTKPVYNGRHRWPQIEPTKIEFSDFSVHMPVAHAQPMLDWYQSSVIDGVRDDKTQRTGAIVFLSADRTMPLFRISLDQVGVRNASLAKAESGGDSIKRVKFDLFCGKMDIDQTPSRDPMAYIGRGF
jgi:hypothetical protein